MVDLLPAASDTPSGGAIAGIVLFSLVLSFVLSGLVLMGLFRKAGEAPWAGFVPFYGQYALTRVAGYNPWLFLLLLVPIVSIVFSIMVAFGLGKAFGKGGAFSFFLLWLLSLIGYLVVGYGGAQFVGRGGRVGDRA